MSHTKPKQLFAQTNKPASKADIDRLWSTLRAVIKEFRDVIKTHERRIEAARQAGYRSKNREWQHQDTVFQGVQEGQRGQPKPLQGQPQRQYPGQQHPGQSLKDNLGGNSLWVRYNKWQVGRKPYLESMEKPQQKEQSPQDIEKDQSE